jgi:hypothetical protein
METNSIRRILGIVSLAGLTACSGAGASPALAGEGANIEAQSAAVTTSTVNALVVNTTANPVPTAAQGITAVEGTVAASQSGPWSVSLNGTASVSVAGTANVSLQPGALVGIDPASNAVQLAGTPSVAIANTPSVSVTQMPPVALAGTPTVSLAGTPTVNLGGTPAVTIANAASNPALVRNTDERGRQPFQKTFSISLSSGIPDGIATYAPPAGTRLVIEHVSAQGTVPTGQYASIQLTNGVVPNVVAHFFVLTKANSDSTIDQFLLSQQTVLYSDSSYGALNILVSRSIGTGNAGFDVTLSGYLITL